MAMYYLATLLKKNISSWLKKMLGKLGPWKLQLPVPADIRGDARVLKKRRMASHCSLVRRVMGLLMLAGRGPWDSLHFFHGTIIGRRNAWIMMDWNFNGTIRGSVAQKRRSWAAPENPLGKAVSKSDMPLGFIFDFQLTNHDICTSQLSLITVKEPRSEKVSEHVPRT